MFLIPVLKMQRQADLCDFEVSLVYKVIPDNQGYTEKIFLKTKQKTYT